MPPIFPQNFYDLISIAAWFLALMVTLTILSISPKKPNTPTRKDK